MAKRFNIPSIPKGEEARYAANPFEPSIFGGGYYGFVAPVDGPRGPGVIVRPMDALLLQKGGVQAWIVYNKLLFDETVQSALVKMTQEITGREWKIEAVSDKPGDVAIQEFVEDTLNDLPVDEIYRGMLEAYITGFTVAEIMWKRTKKGVIPFDIRFRDQRRFRFEELLEGDYGFTMRMATREEPMVGVPLPARKFMVFRYWAHNNGDPYGAGLARVLYPLVKFKRRALESQLLYSDRFANPTAVAKAPLSATACEVDTLYDHLSNLSQETALVLPEGFDLEFVNPGGTPETFKDLRESLENQINILIAGEDEAGRQDAGSRASSEVAQTVRRSRAKDLSELVSQTLNETLVRWIVDLNFGTNVVAPKIYRDFEPKEDVQLSMADVAILVKDVGLKPTIQWVTDRFDVELEEEEGMEKIMSGPPGTSGVDMMRQEDQMLGGLREGQMRAMGIDPRMVKGQMLTDAGVPEEGGEELGATDGDIGYFGNDDDYNSVIDRILAEDEGDGKRLTGDRPEGVERGESGPNASGESPSRQAFDQDRQERDDKVQGEPTGPSGDDFLNKAIGILTGEPEDEEWSPGLGNAQEAAADRAKMKRNQKNKARRPPGEIANLTGRNTQMIAEQEAVKERDPLFSETDAGEY